MKIREASEPQGSLTDVNSSEDELVEAVTVLRQDRGVPARGKRKSGKSTEQSAEHVTEQLEHAQARLAGEAPGVMLHSDGNGMNNVSDAVGAEPMAMEPRPEQDGVSQSGQEAGSVSDAASEAGLDPIDPRELVPILEALVFVSHDPLTLERAVTALAVSKADVIKSFQQLQQDYDREGRGLQVVELAGGFRIVTRPEYAPWLKRLEKIRPAPKLSRSALESLAIISYKQPVVRAEIEQIRGVETSGVLRTLLERKLVRMVGRKEVPGRPIMYGTTRYFLEHFGLKDLSELPPLRELKELGESEQAFLPVDDDLLSINHGDAVPSDPPSPERRSESESEAIIATDPH